jgi:prophage antirepressor-like protein
MNIVPYLFDTHTVRTVVIDGAPWFFARDICEILEYSNGPEAIRDHVAPEFKQSFALGLPGRAPTVVNEAGLFSLILASKKPQTVAFKRWVVASVLPSINHTGGYGVSDKLRSAIDAVRRIHEAADRDVERKTQHDFYRPDSLKAQDHIRAVVAEVAARTGLDVAAVELARKTSVREAMAEVYGDPLAIRDITREKARIAAEVSKRLAASRKTYRRRSR